MSRFINPSSVIAQAGWHSGQTVADLGAGSGFYAVPIAKIVGSSGTVYAVDVQDAKLDATQSTARQHGLKNITVIKADLDKPLLQIPEGSCDGVVVVTVIHEIDDKAALIKNAYRLLKTGGNLLVVAWKKELTPFGPAVERRLTPDELESLLLPFGFRKTKEINADKYHYALLFTK